MPYMFFFFFFNDTATTEIYTLSLHDALPISARRKSPGRNAARTEEPEPANRYGQPRPTCLAVRLCADTSGSRRRDDVPWPLVLAPRLSRARSLSIWRTRNASMDSSSVERFVRKRTAAQPGRHALPGVGRSIEPAEAWESRPAAQEVGSRIERLEIAQLLDHREGISHRC